MNNTNTNQTSNYEPLIFVESLMGIIEEKNSNYSYAQLIEVANLIGIKMFESSGELLVSKSDAEKLCWYLNG